MICLAIDSASTVLSLALIKGDETFCFSQEMGKSGHSARLVPAIDELLKAHDVTPDMLEVVAVNVGPGSFTGIRIGVAAATALAFATGAKRICVTSFEIIAYDRGRIVAAIDAGHGNLYCADCEDGRVISTRFLEAGEKPNFDAVSEPKSDPADAMAQIVRKKAKNGEFCNVFVPMYMRKSQAEREKE